MKSWQDILITPKRTIIETMKLIDETTRQFAVVVDGDKHLIGTVTDGDIRRGILKGCPLEAPIEEVMNQTPISEMEGKNATYYKKMMVDRKLKQLPIVNHNGQVVHVLFSDEIFHAWRKENTVVLMAGGLGTRLRPLTNDTPKPMLKVGDKPILETIIDSFKTFGFVQFIICVNYKKDMIMEYFQDGSHLGVYIEYVEESKRLGTAGALSLLKKQPTQPFFVMNADLLSKINFEQLLSFHLETKSMATMCVREYEYQVPYGVIETEDHRLLSIVEKPVQKEFVNAGIYVLDPEMLKYVPEDQFFDMPDLFKRLIEAQKEVSAFPLREYWLDIGKIDDYEKANGDFRGGYL